MKKPMKRLLFFVLSLQICACSKPGELDFSDGSSFAHFEEPVIREEPEVEVVPGKRTIATVTANNLLTSMLSVTKVTTVSTVTRQTYDRNKGSLSLEGSATSVTAPMLMSVSAIAAEVCNDLVNQERALQAAQRNFFADINFAGSPQLISDMGLSNSVRRMARAFWGRDETAEERTIITASTREIIQGQTATAQTINAMMATCTGMLSSLSALEQ